MSIKGFSIGGVTQKYDYNALDNIPEVEGLSEEAKQALLQLAQKVAYIDDQGQTYYQALYNALYPPEELVSISAIYTQSGTVYDTDSLDSLKTDLVVTAVYSDSSTATVPSADYTLSGTLTAGTSTITVSYSGKTTTFQVTVTHEAWYVTDGLLMLLDGEKNGVNGAHETALTTWVDQSGNGYNWTNSGATVNAKSIAFANPSYLTMAQALPAGVKTIEIVMSTPHSSGAMILAGFGDAKPGNIQMGTGDGMLFHTGTSKTGWSKITAAWAGIHAYSCVGSSRGYRDGVDAFASISVSSSWPNTTPRIGLYNGSGTNQFLGEIYCLRLYNRELTEEELLANYAVDAARFGIGG